MEEWRRRVLAMLFACDEPVDRAVLAQAVGTEVSVEAVIAALRDGLADEPLEVVRVGSGWMMRTRRAYVEAVRLAVDPGGDPPRAEEMTAHEVAVLAAIAYYQPVTRADLGDVFGQTPGTALLGRLKRRGLIAAGPRAPVRGAPHTYVTTPLFLTTFDYDSLDAFADDVPDLGEGAPRRASTATQRRP
jgi:segregation and condensation protein B